VQLKPVHAWHRHIDENDIRSIDLVPVEALAAARKSEAVVPVLMHEPTKGSTDKFVVVNDAYESRIVRHIAMLI
jgi:hypothetical protein